MVSAPLEHGPDECAHWGVVVSHQNDGLPVRRQALVRLVIGGDGLSGI
ncbi:MAG: hypothetical protein ABIP93_19790 [Gemmatimonadaceae bacterium]